MTKQGLIIAIDGDMATVEGCKNIKCDHCPKRSRIGACDACPDHEEKISERVIAYNRIGAEIGDKVEYTKNKISSIVFALVSFVVPILCAIISYLICTVFTDDEQIKGRVAFTFFVLALLIAGAYSYKVSKKQCDHSIISVIDMND